MTPRLAVRGDCLPGQSTAEEAVAAARAGGDAWISTVSLYNQGRVHATCGDDRAALSFYAQALVSARTAHDAFMTTCIRTAAAAATYRLGHHTSAVLLLQEFLPVMRGYGDTRHIALIPANLGYAAARRGDIEETRRYFRGSLQYGLDLGDLINSAGCIAGLGVCAGLSAEPRQAATLFGAAHALLAATGAVNWPGDRLSHEPWIVEVGAVLDERTFKQAWAEGAALTREQAVVLALTV